MSKSQALVQPHGYFVSDCMRGNSFYCLTVLATHTLMLTSLIDTRHCSGYSATTDWERMVYRGKDYNIIKKKKCSCFSSPSYVPRDSCTECCDTITFTFLVNVQLYFCGPH